MNGLNLKKMGVIFSILMIVSLFFISTVSAAIWTVCPFDAPVTCDSMTIQGGIDLASSGDTVQVAEGIYFENVVLKSGITLEGGWKNDFTVRDSKTYVSVIDGTGLTGDTVSIEAKSEIIIDSFTIQNSNNEGIKISNSSKIVILTSIIQNNKFGVRITNSNNVSINKTTIKDHVDNFMGTCEGGVGITISSSNIVNIIANNILDNNSSGACAGSGIVIYDSNNIVVSQNLIKGNFNTTWGGAGIYTSGISSSYNNIFSKNIIINNSTPGPGGGISLSSYFIVENNIIANNTASRGAGIYIRGGSGTLINNTLTRNESSSIYIESGNITLKNTISYANNGEDLVIARGSIAVSYSNICDTDGVTPYPGSGNLCVDPQFVDPANGDYHLLPTSPMIDIANPVGAPSDDIDGDTRPQGDGYDIGADEYVEVLPPSTISGFVTDPDHLPIHGATVRLKKAGELIDTTTTDINGYYEFLNIPDGRYVIIGRKSGYNRDKRIGKVIENRPWAKDEFINLILSP